MKQETMGWQWHQLDHMQIICTLLQADSHASTSSIFIFYTPDALPDAKGLRKNIPPGREQLSSVVCLVCGVWWRMK